jgi:hypothetical protein
MGSLITALQNQNIAATNQETLGDIYAANPTNLGYTDNPFGYTAAPAVIQTAYPKYGYNATAPKMPPSYEEYDLTTLFSMLQSMQQDGQPQSFTAPVPTVAPMTEVQAPATPAGILAAMSAQPLPDAYSALNSGLHFPVVAEPEPEPEAKPKEEKVAAAPEMTLGDYIRLNKADPDTLRMAQAKVPYQLNPNISMDEAYRIAYNLDDSN